LKKKDFEKELETIKNGLRNIEKEYRVYWIIGWISSGEKTYSSKQLKIIFELKEDDNIGKYR